MNEQEQRVEFLFKTIGDIFQVHEKWINASNELNDSRYKKMQEEIKILHRKNNAAIVGVWVFGIAMLITSILGLVL